MVFVYLYHGSESKGYIRSSGEMKDLEGLKKNKNKGGESFDYRLFFSIMYFSCLAMSSFLFAA